MKKKIALLMACVMTLCVAIGGTLAWLTAKTDDVTNVFTPSDISITLTETTGDEYKMVPGQILSKDPEVTIKANSEACWLVIKVEEVKGVVTYTKADKTTATTTWDEFLTYTVDSNWIALDSSNTARQEGIYYRVIDATTAKDGNENSPYAILSDDKVTVKTDVTKEMMNALLVDANSDGKFDTDDEGNLLFDEDKVPELKFTAYAIQQAHIADDATKTDAENAAIAWAEINKPATNP